MLQKIWKFKNYFWRILKLKCPPILEWPIYFEVNPMHVFRPEPFITPGCCRTSGLRRLGQPPPYLLGRNSRALPPRPPTLHHGDEAGEHHTSCQDAENASKAVDVQGVAALPRLHRAVQVTGAVPGPPLQLQYVHVSVLLELQDSESRKGERNSPWATICNN